MLQQTQVNRVIEKYPQFLRRFPTLKLLAHATRASVIRAWQGMGYNRRAVQLHSLAREVMNRHGGKLPQTIEKLKTLPGVGRYTAHAIACSAFHQAVPVVETNVARVLSRLFPARKTDIWALAWSILPSRQAYDWNQALMDLGATVCTSGTPKCVECPVSKSCPSAFKTKSTRVKRSRKEPGRDGIPNRIYRGKIIEILRSLNGKRFMHDRLIGGTVKPGFDQKDRAWLAALLEGLAKDGLIDLKKRKKGLLVSLKR